MVPGPPAIVPELMGSAAPELDDLRHAADTAVSRALADLTAPTLAIPLPAESNIVATSADSDSDSTSDRVQLVVVGPGAPGEFSVNGLVSFASFGRDVSIPGLVEGGQTDDELPTPLMVARYLASRDIAAHPDHAELWASARWFTTRGGDATDLGEWLRQDARHVVLILVADGAACHGSKAPRAEDERAALYDDAVCAILASGQLGALAGIDDDLGAQLGATGPQVWPLLTAAADGDGMGEVLWTGAPYGVGWTVATWR